MSNRKLKRKMIKDFGVEKFSDRIKRKLNEKSNRKLRADKEGTGGGA